MKEPGIPGDPGPRATAIQARPDVEHALQPLVSPVLKEDLKKINSAYLQVKLKNMT